MLPIGYVFIAVAVASLFGVVLGLALHPSSWWIVVCGIALGVAGIFAYASQMPKGRF